MDAIFEMLGIFLIANMVTEEEIKQTILLSVIGPCTFKLLRNLLTPEKLGDKPYSNLFKVLKITLVQNLLR